MIYIDCTECIPDGSVSFHGGGNYGKRMVEILSKEMKIAVLLPESFQLIDEKDKQIFRNANVTTYIVKDLCEFDKFCADDILFLPLLPTRRLHIVKKIKNSSPTLKVYVTIHGTRMLDIVPEYMDEYYGVSSFKIVHYVIKLIKYFFARILYKKTFNKYIPYFDKVFTVSNDSMQKIISISTPQTIKPFYCGSINSEELFASEKQKENFALLVSGGRPEKNTIRTILGFQEFKKRDLSGLKLVITGVSPEKKEQILSYPLIDKKITSVVEILPYVSENKLKELYQSCKFVVCLSKSEGFGLAMVESVQNNIPILASAVTAVPEVLWSGAIYANPYKVKAIAKGFEDMQKEYEKMLKKIEYRKIVVHESIKSSDRDFVLEFKQN